MKLFFAFLLTAGAIFSKEVRVFESYQIESADTYVEKKSKENVSDAEKKIIEERIKNKTNNTADLERISFVDTKNYEAMLNYAVSISTSFKCKEIPWEERNKVINIAVYVCEHSKEPEEKAKALLLYVNLNDYEAGKILAILNDLMPVQDLKKKFPQYQNIYALTLKSHELNAVKEAPELVLSFNKDLDPKITYKDFVMITPDATLSVTISGKELILRGLDFNKAYTVTLKKGLPSKDSDKIDDEQKISVITSDRDSLLSFPANTYILSKNDDQFLPLSFVNVEEAKLTLSRLSDQAFAQHLSGSYTLEGQPDHWSIKHNKALSPIAEKIIQLGGERNKNFTKQIPLKDLIKDLKPGIYLIAAEQMGSFKNPVTVAQKILITDIALTTYRGNTGLDVQARSISTATPLDGITIDLKSYNNETIASLKTDIKGYAHFDEVLLLGKAGDRPMSVMAYGTDQNFSYLKLRMPAFDFSDRGVSGRNASKKHDCFVYTERGVYRSGETLPISMLVRDPFAKAVKGIPLYLKIHRPDGEVVFTKQLKSDESGFVNFSYTLSDSARSGMWTINVHDDPKTEAIGTYQFSVEDFVPARLLVSVNIKDDFMDLAKPISAEIIGKFLYGTPAQNLKGEAWLEVVRHPNPFPNHQTYSFGDGEEKFQNKNIPLPTFQLDEKGLFTLTTSVKEPIESSFPLMANVKGIIFDEAGKPNKGSKKVPLKMYASTLGVKLVKQITPEDKDANLNLIALNSKEELESVKGAVYQFYAQDSYYSWVKNGYKWAYEVNYTDKLLKEGSIDISKDGKTAINVSLDDDYSKYKIVVKDPKTTSKLVYTFKSGYSSDSKNTDSPDQLKISLDKKEYKPGENIKLNVDSPFDGKVSLVLAQSEVLETINDTIQTGKNEFTLKPKKEWASGFYILATAVRPLKDLAKQPKKMMLMPKRAVGVQWVGFDTKEKTLKVSFPDLKESIKPRTTLDLGIQVEGNMKNETFVTIAAVDEGILLLTDYKMPNPMEFFFGKKKLQVEMRDLYGKIMDPIPGEKGVLREGGDGSALSANLAKLSKKSFKIVSLFQGPLPLDKNGKASVKLQMPDFNGSLRFMAIAYNEDSLGLAEQAAKIHDDIVVEPLFPRYLIDGDQSHFSLSLNNTLKDAKKCVVSIETKGPLKVEQKDHIISLEKEWDKAIAITTTGIGDGQVIIKVKPDGSDEVVKTVDLTVKPSSMIATKRISKFLKPQEKLDVDESILKDFYPENLTLKTSTGVLPWSADVLIEKALKYPYACTEQTVTKAFCAFHLKDTEKAAKYVREACAYLAQYQAYDGGFSLWSNTNSDPWLTAYCADFLQTIKDKNPSPLMLEKVYNNLESFVRKDMKKGSQSTLISYAYSLYVLVKGEHSKGSDVRYFYDTYYGDIKNPMGQLFVLAALAKIGDKVRLEQGLEKLHSFDQFEGSPYGSSFRDQMMSLRLLHNIDEWTPHLENVTKSIQGLISQVPNLEQLSTSEIMAALLAGQDDATSKTIKDLKDESLKNTSDKAQFVSLTLSGDSKIKTIADSKGVELKRQLYHAKDGTPVSGNVKEGELYVILIEGKLTEALLEESQLLVVDMLPSAFEHDLLPLPAFEPWKELDPTVYNAKKDDRYLATLAVNKDQKFKIAYMVRAITPGTYQYPGLKGEDMFNPRVYGTAASEAIVIAPALG